MSEPDTRDEFFSPAAPPAEHDVDPADADVMADYHRLLVDNTDSGLVLCDSDGFIVSANPSAERLLGLSLR